MTVSEVAPSTIAEIHHPRSARARRQASVLFADRVLAVSNLTALALSAALALGLFVYYLRQSARALFFTPYSLLEEAAYTYISANNYLRFGYANSGWLQDFSTSPNPADHPYVYNHMPAGPDLFTSVLLWLFNGNYVSVRAFFACTMLAGLVIYVAFARVLLARLGIRFWGVVVLLISPWVIIQLFDRQIYSPFLLLAFLPLVLVARFLTHNNVAYLAGAAVIIFASAIYIEYSLLSAIIFCWGMLYVTQLLPLKFRHMLVIGAAFGAGIGAHLIQNMLYLGWDTFVLELRWTISNRTTGFPTQQQLRDFYQGLGIVHHGSRPVEPAALKSQIWANFSTPVTLGAMLMFFSCALWLFSWRGLRFADDSGNMFDWKVVRAELLLWARVGAWAIITILAPIILFPAFAQEVNLRGVANIFFLAIPFAFIAGYGIWVLSYAGHRVVAILKDPADAEGRPNADIAEPGAALARLGVFVCRGVALIGISVAAADASLVLLRSTTYEVSHIQRLSQDSARWSPLYDIRRFSGELFMTNINVPTVGFLTAAPGFGVCSPSSVGHDGRLALRECKTSFMRRHDYWLAQRPRYFFYFSISELFPGFADCMPTGLLIGSTRGGNGCMEQLQIALAARYPLVLKNELVSVFDLAAGAPDRKEN